MEKDYLLLKTEIQRFMALKREEIEKEYCDVLTFLKFTKIQCNFFFNFPEEFPR